MDSKLMINAAQAGDNELHSVEGDRKLPMKSIVVEIGPSGFPRDDVDDDFEEWW